MKTIKITLILSIIVMGTNCFSQKNADFFKIMEGKWTISSDENQGFQIWEKVNEDKLIIKEFRIFDNDTIRFGYKEITKAKEIFLQDFGFVKDENSISMDFILNEIDNNCYSFRNFDNEDVLSLNYLVLEKNKVYFWTETDDDDFICIDYILIKNE